MKRVFLNKQFFVLLFSLLLLNGLLFIREQMKSLEPATVKLIMKQEVSCETEISKIGISAFQTKAQARLDKLNVMMELIYNKQLKEDSPDSYLENFKESDVALRERYPTIAKEFDGKRMLMNTENIIAESIVLNRVLERFHYMDEFNNKLNLIKVQQNKLSKISIFSNPDSFSSNNLKKTGKDYARMEQVTIQYMNDRGFQAFMNYKLKHYFFVFFILTVMLQFLKERKRELHLLIFATPKGRFTLAWKRILLLLGSSMFGSVVFYGSILVCGQVMCGGTIHLGRAIQSIPMLGDFTLPISIGSFLVIYFMIQALGCFLSGMLVWIIFVWIRERSLGILIISVIYINGFFFYRFIPIQSNFVLLKYTNFFYYLDISGIFTDYFNIAVGSKAIGKDIFTVVSILIYSTIFIVIGLIANTRIRPNVPQNRLEKIAGMLVVKVRRMTSHFTIAIMEGYKMVWVQKTWIVLLLFLWVCYSSMQSSEVYFGARQEFLNDFFSEWEGPVDEEVDRYVIDLKEEIQAVNDEFQKAQLEFSEGKLEETIWSEMQYKKEAYQYKEIGLVAVESQLKYLMKLRKEEGMDKWLVNNRGYEVLLGKESYKNQELLAIRGILCLILVLSGIIVYERQSDMCQLLRSTERGRGFLFRKKCYSAVVLTFVVWLINYGFEIINVIRRYPLRCLNAPLHSLKFMENVNFHGSILAFIMGLSLSRLLLFGAVTGVIIFVSTMASRMENCILINILLLAPTILNMVGIHVFRYLSVAKLVGGMQLINKQGFVPYIIMVTVGMIVGVIAYYLGYQKWNTTN